MRVVARREEGAREMGEDREHVRGMDVRQELDAFRVIVGTHDARLRRGRSARKASKNALAGFEYADPPNASSCESLHRGPRLARSSATTRAVGTPRAQETTPSDAHGVRGRARDCERTSSAWSDAGPKGGEARWESE